MPSGCRHEFSMYAFLSWSFSRGGANMKRLIFSLSGLLLVLCFSAGAGSAAQWILVLRPSGTSWQIQEAERLTFNQKDKLRVGSADMGDFPAEQYKRLRPVPAGAVGMIRRHAGGFLVRKNSDGTWEPLLPDGLKQKVTSYAEAWRSATVEFRKERNAKASTSVPAADVVAMLPGTDSNLEV